ncbi:extracellular solute-binding protein [Cellulomonas sp. DKR-3]|uniref:Extracellular solute-binding protein n=1 Tax=Cellulomonas fulva TaxID=2835530 RepID=A0ABS5TV30_9CELL|nr:extracellular solute-binding protein [Cellulomonas fulva]MBT0992990.1 extracellular solute-binding protein [Cellulomonas fulva]
MTTRLLRRTAVAAALVATLAACAPQAAQVDSSASTGTVDTDAASLGDVTLKFLDFSGGNDEVYMKKAIAAFEDAYPNITIERTAADFDQVMATLNLRLADKDGPDVATINNGWQSMGTLSKGGLLLNLDPYADAYGWRDQMAPTIQTEHEFTTDGATMGKGSLWGTPGARLTTMGVYYNVDKLDALGLEAPTSVEDFEAALAAAKDAGEVPIEQGMQEKTFATAPLFLLQTMLGDPTKITDFVYGNGDGDLAGTGMLDAAQKLADWSKNGWFNGDASGLDLEAGRNAFQAGTGVFHFDYSGSMAEEGVDGSKFARLALPQDDEGAAVAVGAPAAVLGIAARTEHPDAAAAFVDYLGSVEMNQLAVDSGMLPIRYDGVTLPDDGGVYSTELEQTDQVTQHDGYVPFFDWASPNMLDILGGQAQLVFAGKSTPQQLVDAAQADYDDFHAGK